MYCTVDKSHCSATSSTNAKPKDGKDVSPIVFQEIGVPVLPTCAGVTMREKKSGALSRMQKLRKRLSHSFGRLLDSATRQRTLSVFDDSSSKTTGYTYMIS
ncbi:hypothetical protein GWI33_014320 [Rhynchophorus ferrugineus]|uniref:Uncharacterized protein n=1 Tax=Rhynchophorus ferrugineus TaxID=354439 RepID=A0A834I4Q7_RHYFE|nr:hypothetical protein GWI33_014320 [Rhynchophorus ferrugineus]